MTDDNKQNIAPNAKVKKEVQLIDFVKKIERVKPNDAESVLNAIDVFCWKFHWMMNIGPDKGKILDMAIKECKPKYILELGAYCGYSSIRMVHKNKTLNNINDTKLFTIEFNDFHAKIANEMITHSGYNNNIEIVKGDTKNIIPTLKDKIDDEKFEGFDFVFIDHWKNVYLRDLKLIEKYGLLKSGSYVVADNVLYFEQDLKEYVSYMQDENGSYKSKTYKSCLEYVPNEVDGVEVSIRK